jgi:hypothetical protein
MILSIETVPNDIDTINKYIVSYSVQEGKKKIGYRETTTPTKPENVNALDAPQPTEQSWEILFERKAEGKWETVKKDKWEYPFPPILVWKNLPAIRTPYGKSDIDDVLPLQDRYNLLESNVSKIVRLYSHPQRYGINLSTQMVADTSFGPDQMPMFNTSEGGKIEQLPPVGDLPAAIAYLDHVHDSAFEIAREVDWIKKNLAGRMTNFAMKVLCKDMLDKLGTKRMLYGEALREINRRMLILGGFDPETCNMDWPDPMPEDETLQSTAITQDLSNGLVSHQTASELRNYDWQKEQLRMSAEKTSGDNVGAALIKNFFTKGPKTNSVASGNGDMNNQPGAMKNMPGNNPNNQQKEINNG